MSGVIDSIERAQLRRVPVFQAGDRVRVHFQVVEGTRRRTQVFEGVVIKRQGSGARETFTVRKQSFGVGVERTFPVHSPKIERIEVAGRGDVRRAKLYYLRDRVGRGARVRERRFGAEESEAFVEGAMPPPEADEAAVAEDPRVQSADEVVAAEAEQAAEAAQAEEQGAGDEPSTGDTPPEESPAGEPAADEPAADEPAAEEAPAEEAPAEEAPAEEAPAPADAPESDDRPEA